MVAFGFVATSNANQKALKISVRKNTRDELSRTSDIGVCGYGFEINRGENVLRRAQKSHHANKGAWNSVAAQQPADEEAECQVFRAVKKAARPFLHTIDQGRGLSC